MPARRRSRSAARAREDAADNAAADAALNSGPTIPWETIKARYREEPMARVTIEDLRNRFTYHPPFGNQAERYGMIRDKALELAEVILVQTPASREQSSAFTRLEEAIMHANASIARNEQPEPVAQPVEAQPAVAEGMEVGSGGTEPIITPDG